MSSIEAVENAKARFKAGANADRMQSMILKALTAWNEVEISDEELADYFKVACAWLEHDAI